jgi:hypothetical protein
MDEVVLHIVVHDPLPGVTLRVQCGRTQLVEPASVSASEAMFVVPMRIGPTPVDGRPNFLGPFAQGSPHKRFVYVNAGARAGQANTCWDRRAKLFLDSISWRQIEELRAQPGRCLEGHIAGTAADGGPACATVPLLRGGWRVTGV